MEQTFWQEICNDRSSERYNMSNSIGVLNKGSACETIREYWRGFGKITKRVEMSVH